MREDLRRVILNRCRAMNEETGRLPLERRCSSVCMFKLDVVIVALLEFENLTADRTSKLLRDDV